MKKQIQRKRTIRFFIDAAISITEEEDFHSITIRKVANKAGYNSATLYNYFDNLDHLKALTALTYMSDYTEALSSYLTKATNAYEINSAVWECFFHYSYKTPERFHSIFGQFISKDINNHFKEFYDLYPEKLNKVSNEINGMLLEENIYNRSMFLLKKCSEEGYFYKKDLEDIDDMIFFIYRGMMGKLLSPIEYSITEDQFVDTAMKYINRIFNSYKIGLDVKST